MGPMTSLNGEIRKMSLAEATTPRDGEVMLDRHWVADDDGIYWYKRTGARGWSPQCNHNPLVAESLCGSLYPDAQVLKVDAVYVGFVSEDYGYNPFPR